MQVKAKRIIAMILALIMVVGFATIASAEIASSPFAVDISKATVKLAWKAQEYDGERFDVEDALVVTYGGIVLEEGKDYVVYNTETIGDAPKKYTVTPLIVGIGHYKGFKTKAFSVTIKKRTPAIDTEEDTIQVSAAALKDQSKSYEGFATVEQGLLFKQSKLQKGKIQVTQDGTIILAKGLKAGLYKVTLKTAATSTVASGSKVVYIQVTKEAQGISDAAQSEYEYSVEDLKAAKATITIEGVAAEQGGKLVWKSSNKKVKVSSKGVVTLPKGLKAGTYVISVYGKAKGAYEATTTVNVTITVAEAEPVVVA